MNMDAIEEEYFPTHFAIEPARVSCVEKVPPFDEEKAVIKLLDPQLNDWLDASQKDDLLLLTLTRDLTLGLVLTTARTREAHADEVVDPITRDNLERLDISYSAAWVFDGVLTNASTEEAQWREIHHQMAEALAEQLMSGDERHYGKRYLIRVDIESIVGDNQPGEQQYLYARLWLQQVED
jgi:hypothetical protein